MVNIKSNKNGRSSMYEVNSMAQLYHRALLDVTIETRPFSPARHDLLCAVWGRLAKRTIHDSSVLTLKISVVVYLPFSNASNIFPLDLSHVGLAEDGVKNEAAVQIAPSAASRASPMNL